MKVLPYLTLLLLMGGALAAGTPAGTEIKNRAEATYIDPDGTSQTVTSDEIITTVLPVYDFFISPNGASSSAPGQTVSASASGAAQFSYTVTNQGNITDTIALSVVQAGDDGFDLDNVRIYLDKNGNGMLDAGELLLTKIELKPNESVRLIVVGAVPTGTAPGAVANLNLEGASVGAPGNTDADNWARAVLSGNSGGSVAGVNIGNGDGNPNTAPNDGGVNISAQPGKTVSFPLELQNTGDAADSFTLSVPNIPGGWTVQIFADANCDGVADNGTSLTSVGPLNPGENVCLVVTVTPAADAAPGSTPITVTATSQNDPSKSDSITDTVVLAGGSATFGVDIGNSDGNTQTAPNNVGVTRSATPGTPVSLPLELKNTGTTADSFNLTIPGLPSGWTAQVFADTNCDGSADSSPVTSVGPLDPGETVCLVVTVTPSVDAQPGSTPLTVTATSQADPSKSDSITDTLVVRGGGGGATTGLNLGNGDKDVSTAPSDTGVSLTTQPGKAVTYPLELTNTGSTPDTFDLGVASLPAGWTAQVFADVNCDGAADNSAPITQVGSLNPNENVCLVLQVTPAADAQAGSTSVTVTATSRNDPTVSDSITNTVVVQRGGGSVVVGVNLGNGDKNSETKPDDAQKTISAQPGEAVSFPLELTNTGSTPDSFDLSFPNLPAGWTVQIFADADCDGEADSGTPITSVDPLSPGENVCLVATVMPPADAQPGSTPLTVTATSRNDPSKGDSIANTLVIRGGGGGATIGLNLGNGDNDVSTTPSDTGVSVTTRPGQAVSFPLELQNTGSTPDTFNLTLPNLPEGWTAVIFADADCNGKADNDTPISQVGPLDPGENVCLIFTVTPAADAQAGTTPITITATSQNDPSVSDSITNTVVIKGGGGGAAAGVDIGNSDGDRDTKPGDAQKTVSAQPGKTVSYPLELKNTGDAADTFDLTLDLPTGWNAAIFLDADCDGVADDDIPITTVGPLEPGETVCLVVRVTPPADAQPERTPVTVTATSRNDPSVEDSLTDIIVIEDEDGGGTAGAKIVLNKTVSPTGSVVPGTTLTYTVTATNTGDGPATGVSISDPLPANTAFVSASVSTTLDGAALYSEDGSSWSATPPASLGTGESVYVGIDTNGDATSSAADTFGAGDTLTLILNVRVTGGPEVSNQARVDYGNGSASSETVSTDVDSAAPEPDPARCAVSVTPDGTEEVPGQLEQALPGGTVYLPYLLQNIGSQGDAGSAARTPFVLSATTLTGDTQRLRIIADDNANGVLDAGEKVVRRVTLAQGESAALLLEVSLTQTSGTRLVNLGAICEDAGEDAGENTRDTTNVSQIDVPALTLAAPQKTAVPPAGTALYAGASVAYTITFTAPEVPLENVVVQDVLDAELMLPTSFTTGTVTDLATGLTADAVATLEGRTLSWTFAEVPAGMTVNLDVQTQVADDAAVTETVANTACIAASGLTEVCSAPVTHPLAPVELDLSKTALSPTVSVGDTLTYELVATNISGVVPVTQGTLTDALPEGLEYLPDTAVRLDAAGTTEPFEPVQTGQVLVWTIPDLEPGTSLTLRFDVRVTAAALGQETLLNRAEFDALGSDGSVVASQEDEAAVEVEVGIFRTRSVLLGHLYIDRDDSGDFTQGDRPVGDARLYLSNGVSVVTDEFGRYTVTDLPAGLLALRLDSTTIRGLELAENERTAVKDGLWRVRLQPGLLTRQDIGFVPPPAKTKGTATKTAAETAAAKPVSQAAEVTPTPDTNTSNANPSEPDLPASPVETLSGVNLISPTPGTLLRGRSSVPIIVETPLGDVVSLTVNGQVIPSSLLGKRVLDEARQRQRFEYAGVRFEPGESEIVVKSQPAGGAVTEARVTLATAGPPERILVRPLGELTADSAAPLAFVLRLQDENGYAPEDAFVTLTVDGAEFASEDANKRALGMQVRTREGRARFTLKPLPVPATIAVRAELGALASKHDFAVRSAKRPWVAAAAGSVGASLAPGQPLRAAEFGVSGTLFARGTVYGQLLTFGARYPQSVYGDPTDPFSILPSEQLIEPEVVTGSSIDPTTEARSQDGLFARLENDLSFIQYGDFATDLLGPLLGGSRELTGLSGRYANFGGGFEARGYASYRPQGEEITNRDVPSNGTSLYRLPAGLESLVVAAVTKDDFGSLTGQEELARGADYTYTPETGQLLLNDPLPLQNSLGDRFLLRLSYRFPAEVGGPRVLEAGAQLAYDAGDLKPRLGAAQSQDGATTARAVSAGVSYEHGDLTAEADVAYGGDESSSGFAATAQANLEGEQLGASATYRYTAPGYRSPALGVSSSAGHEASFGVSYNVTDALNVSASGTAAQAQRATGNDVNFSADVLGRYRVSDEAALGSFVLGSSPELQLGAEVDTSLGDERNDWVPRALGGFRVQTPFGLPDAEVSVLHRQGLLSTLPSETDFGVRYRLLENLSLTVTERLTWGVESDLLVGLETGFDNASLLGGARYRGQTSVSTQYEIPGGLSADAGRARLGLRTQYPLSDTWSIDGSIEQILDFSDGGSRSAASFGTTYDTDDVDAQASYQFSLDAGLTRHLLSAGSNFRVNDHLFGGVNALYSLEQGTEEPQGFSFNVAGAYRGAVIDVLTSHTGLFGSLSPDGSQLTGDVRAALPLGQLFDLRGSYLYRSKAVVGLQDVTALGVGVYPWMGGSVALYGQLLHLWTPGTYLPGVSLELSQEVFCGLYAVGGYNYGGLSDPLGPGYGGEGFFIRVDIIADEQFTCEGLRQ